MAVTDGEALDAILRLAEVVFPDGVGMGARERLVWPEARVSRSRGPDGHPQRPRPAGGRRPPVGGPVPVPGRAGAGGRVLRRPGRCRQRDLRQPPHRDGPRLHPEGVDREPPPLVLPAPPRRPRRRHRRLHPGGADRATVPGRGPLHLPRRRGGLDPGRGPPHPRRRRAAGLLPGRRVRHHALQAGPGDDGGGGAGPGGGGPAADRALRRPQRGAGRAQRAAARRRRAGGGGRGPAAAAPGPGAGGGRPPDPPRRRQERLRVQRQPRAADAGHQHARLPGDARRRRRRAPQRAAARGVGGDQPQQLAPAAPHRGPAHGVGPGGGQDAPQPGPGGGPAPGRRRHRGHGAGHGRPPARDRGRRGRRRQHRHRRRRAPRPGPDQPAQQRGQVHARRRPDLGHREPAGRPRRAGRRRHRLRHPRRRAAPGVRALLPVVQRPADGRVGHRPGPGHREGHRRAPRGDGVAARPPPAWAPRSPSASRPMASASASVSRRSRTRPRWPSRSRRPAVRISPCPPTSSSRPAT